MTLPAEVTMGLQIHTDGNFFLFLKLKPKAGKVKKEGKEKRCINDKMVIFFLQFLNQITILILLTPQGHCIL